MRTTLLAAALATGLAGGTAATEYTTFRLLDVTPRGPSGEPGCRERALLNLPAGWQSGDAVVILLTAVPLLDAPANTLVAAMLAEQAAVLELSPGPPQACIDEAASPAEVLPSDALATLFGGLVAARHQAGGGLLVAIGHGTAGLAVLDAIEEPEAAARLGPDGPRLAAAIALGDWEPIIRRGVPQRTAEHADYRLALLCRALAGAGATMGSVDAEACVAALAADPQAIALKQGP